MARLFGLIGNRPDLCGRVLAVEAEALRVQPKPLPSGSSGAGAGTAAGAPAGAAGDKGGAAPGSIESGKSGGPLGWGLGFYQGGEVLMRRRPIDERQEIDVAQLAADVRADVLVGHVRSATVGSLRTENTHPFRYRQWLFAATGTVAPFEPVRERLIASVPEFLRGNIRGETDSEVVFHVFLSFLHDAGRLSDGAAVEPQVVRDALRSSLAVVDGMAAEVGGGPGELNILIANGDELFAVHKADRMCFRVLSGKSDADMILGDDMQLRRRAPELGNMHFTVIAGHTGRDLPPRWKPVAKGSIVTMTRSDAPRIEPL